MKIKKTFGFHAPLFALRAGYQVIATFGTARLVRKSDGRHELVGGSADDHANAREWGLLFHHEAVFPADARSRKTFSARWYLASPHN